MKWTSIQVVRGICGLLLFVSSACSKGNTTMISSTALGDQTAVIDIAAEPEHLDPSLATDVSSAPPVMNLFEGLVEFNPKDLSPVPAIAERWTISPDGKIYTFFLRKTAKWSDGSAITADDFVYTWRRIVDPKTASDYAYYLYYLKNGKDLNQRKKDDLTQLGVKAVDPTTLRVELERPTSYFLSLLAFYTFRVVKKDVVEQYHEQWTKPEHIVSSGAFKLVEWIPNKQLVLVPNPYYWDREKVKLKKVVFLPIEDRETAMKMFLNGQLHYVKNIPNIKVASLRDHPEFVDGPQLATLYVELNTKRPPLDDKRVRQALSMAIDREQLVKVLNVGIANDSFTPKEVGGYEPPPGLGFHPEQARKLLAEAGYADPKKFPSMTITYNTNENYRMVMEVVQSMWKQNLGIEMKLINMEWKTVLKTLDAKDFELARFGWVGDYPDANTFLELFASGSGNNHTGWANERYDHLIAESGKTLDKKRRYALLHEAEALFLEEAPVVPVYTFTWPTLTSKHLEGFYHNLLDLHPLKEVVLK